MNSLDYVIIGTGSKGNAVRIENIMIDCGVSFKKMKEELYKCDTLLITHVHSDHLKISTFDQIRREFPRIKVYGNYEVAETITVDKIIHLKPFKLRKSKILVTPFDGFHDVEVTGYFLEFPNGINALYMTDTSKVKCPVDLPIDYCFLESNYSEDKLKQIAKQYSRKGYDPIANAKRHLSSDQCEAFYYTHRRNENSKLIELHMSERFY